MFFIKIYIKESYMNYYHTSIQMCGQYCILAPDNKSKFKCSSTVGGIEYNTKQRRNILFITNYLIRR